MAWEKSQEAFAFRRGSSHSKDLIEVLFRSPYCKIKSLEDAGIVKRQTASTYLKELEQIGILRGLKFGRDVYYVNDDFLKALID